MSMELWQRVKALEKEVEELKSAVMRIPVINTERLTLMEQRYTALNARVSKALKKQQE